MVGRREGEEKPSNRNQSLGTHNHRCSCRDGAGKKCSGYFFIGLPDQKPEGKHKAGYCLFGAHTSQGIGQGSASVSLERDRKAVITPEGNIHHHAHHLLYIQVQDSVNCRMES